MEIGDRVLIKHTGDVGHITNMDMSDDLGYCDVRVLTPNNEPSVLTTVCPIKELVKVSENVVPAPKSEEWWQESREFCSMVESLLSEVIPEEEGGEE